MSAEETAESAEDQSQPEEKAGESKPADASADAEAADAKSDDSATSDDSSDPDGDAAVKADKEPAEKKPKKAKKAKAKKKPEAEAVEDSGEIKKGMSSEEDKKWFVVQAFSGFEKQAAKSLQDHIDRYDMQKQFGRILVPTEEVVEMKGGQKRTSERKFFPGYVLVEMNLTDESWHLVKGVPKVTGFIGGTGTSPTPISDKEASEIMQQLEEGADKPRPKFTFAPGEMVRVIDGPFQDFNGSVEDVNFEKSKLRVSVSIFGRSTPVELNFSQVEKS